MPNLLIILYEGVEDRAFLEELLKVLGLEKKFDFHEQCGGKDRFEQILKGLVISKHKTIIIVADNDGDPAEAFKNVQRQIAAAGFTVPQNPRETVATAELPPLSVLMIPWDNDSGCLETLCLSAVSADYKKQLECADALIKCAGAEEWDIARKSKLRMRGFLSAACKSDPNTGLRYAWNRAEKPFPLKDVAVYTQIANYLKSFADAEL